MMSDASEGNLTEDDTNSAVLAEDTMAAAVNSTIDSTDNAPNPVDAVQQTASITILALPFRSAANANTKSQAEEDTTANGSITHLISGTNKKRAAISSSA